VNIPKNVLMAAVAAGFVLVATAGTAAAATPSRSVAPVLSDFLQRTAFLRHLSQRERGKCCH